MEATARQPSSPESTFRYTQESVQADYRLACESREASLLGRKEVLTGKAKFGIFGDGKEVAQLAMAKAFRAGDFRSGYYRDQTFMFATGMATIRQFFAQLYADPDPSRDPSSSGRQMNAHFSSPTLNPDGSFRDLTAAPMTSADLSPTGSQMPRLVGLAYASKLYRELDALADRKQFSNSGNEVAFGTIGNASCAEGMFWEAVNAVGVLQAPMLLSLWDDGYGISVPNEYQITKTDLSEMLSGFERTASERGYRTYRVAGWDYKGLCETYLHATELVRGEHVPAILHVHEMTQPQGHSTSGSHERYKSKERLAWEGEWDCLRKMREWILAEGLADAGQMDAIESESREHVREEQQAAWREFREPLDAEAKTLIARIEAVEAGSTRADELTSLRKGLERQRAPFRRDLAVAARRALLLARDEDTPARRELIEWNSSQATENEERYGSHLYSESSEAAARVPGVEAIYADDASELNGFEIMQACFDANLARHDELIFMGEDVGHIGGVNQGLAGMQERYGRLRVSDTGIRECTIIGQAIGMATRGLRPVAEMQYLDYVLYGLQILSDDLATLRYRTGGMQKAPVIIRTRGHRLEGVWHSGSQMGGIVSLVRGIHVCVPRNMTQAAGFYNTMLASDDSAIIVEVLNAYRNKERLPANIGEFTVPLGIPEVLREGEDVTLVTYGACCPIALAAATELAEVGIEVEVIDVQTLLPFDREARIVDSLAKTSRIVFLDEDVPGGASAYMMQQVLEVQGGYHWLDAEPRTLSGTEHRPAYGSDGDYYSKPSREDVFTCVYELMHESDPARYPLFYR